MYNKYYYFKNIFKNYVILFLKNGNYKSFGYDCKMIKYVESKQISCVIINDLFEVEIINYDNNNYIKYLIIEFLIDLSN